MHRVALLASLLLAYAPKPTPAQTANVICQASTIWTANDEGQSPCLVAAFLVGQCLPDPSDAVVHPLNNLPGITNYYVPPQASALLPTDCTCNTVLYSLIAACGACQGQGWISWTSWDENCQQSYVATYPDKIPPTVSVPRWAYIDVTEHGGTFSPSLAEQIAAENLPDIGPLSPSSSSSSSSSSASSPTSVALPPSATTPVIFPTPTSGLDTSSGGESKKSNVGPIVGGVVGGIGGIALIALAVWFCFLRKKRTTARPNNFNIEPPASAVPLNGSEDLEKPLGTPTTGGGYASPTGLGYVDYQSLQTPPPMMPYNPDDPSTFPSALLSSPAPTSYAPISTSTPPPPGTGAYTPTSYTTSTPPPFGAGAGMETCVRPNLLELDGAYTPTGYVSPSPRPAQQQHVGGAGAIARVRPNVPEL
ncbi:hypothetical protein BDW22DRAFT_1357424 [Trametopsis cervina]|nr:hypothetical protein BDW22DRAFT_1357424 [Trametopsis cervina]